MFLKMRLQIITTRTFCRPKSRPLWLIDFDKKKGNISNKHIGLIQFEL
jgi:hypothetical protein